MAVQFANKSMPTLAEVTRRVTGISSLPQVALRVMEVAANPNSTASDLKEAMECDPSLSARVLQCVNSSAYATRIKITNLQHAITYLGIKQIRNLAMTASVSQLFSNAESIGSYERRALWRHLVAVGICARLIAMRQRLQEFEDVFIAGLLHDIGIILIDQHLHKYFCDVMASLQDNETLSACESRILAFDHCRLGESLAQAWRFPPGVIDTIRHHHDAARYTGPQLATVRCVEVANFVCSLKGITSVGRQLVVFPKATFQEFGLTKDDLLVLVDDLDRELANNQMLFQL